MDLEPLAYLGRTVMIIVAVYCLLLLVRLGTSEVAQLELLRKDVNELKIIIKDKE